VTTARLWATSCSTKSSRS